MGALRGKAARIRRVPVACLVAALAAVAPLSCAGGVPRQLVERFETCTDAQALALLGDGRAHLAAGRDEAALPLLEEVLLRCPEMVPVHHLHREAALRAGQRERVAALHGRLWEGVDAPGPVALYAAAGLEADPSRRLALLDGAVRQEPRFYFGWLSRGRVLRSLGRNEEAVEALERVLAIHPYFVEADLDLAELKAELGSPLLASLHYRRYLALHPQDRRAREDYVRLLVESGEDLDEAEVQLARLQAEDPLDTDLLLVRAALHWRRGDLEGARDAYRQVLRRVPASSAALLNLGNLYFAAMGSLERARHCYLHYLDAPPAAGVADVLDRLFTVPHRLRRIEERIGPLQGPLLPSTDL